MVLAGTVSILSNASSTNPSTADITVTDATAGIVMSDATVHDEYSGDEDLSTYNVIYDPIVDQSWLLKCYSTDLTRLQLCIYLSFANTQKLCEWECQALEPPRARSVIDGWVTRQCRQPLLYITFGVEEIAVVGGDGGVFKEMRGTIEGLLPY